MLPAVVHFQVNVKGTKWSVHKD